MPAALDADAILIDEASEAVRAESERLVLDAEDLLARVGDAICRGHRALVLWRRWFDRFGDPWFLADGQQWCAFCDGANMVHRKGCVYEQARKLLGLEEGAE